MMMNEPATQFSIDDPLPEPALDPALESVLRRVRIRARRRAAWLRKLWAEEGESGGK